MKKFLACAFAVAALLSTGCVKSPVVGGVYTDVKDGLAVTGNAGSSKVGTAEVKGYVGLVAMGDASIQTAAREAGITRIHHVDYQSKSYLGLYTIYTIIVYGD
ncbi:TRL-like family protein [uncultured Alistipes sp.]|uniref:TRL-like family protein n=1 Tax=uncultured Alistipes sp. TaxID=538949 RepID=UPI002803AC98|nr:TRL-like family protein [uncultured Alistipes sp.]